MFPESEATHYYLAAEVVPSWLGSRRAQPPGLHCRCKTDGLATVTTNCGDIEFTLDGEKAPQAVASFLELAKQNYYLMHLLARDCTWRCRSQRRG